MKEAGKKLSSRCGLKSRRGGVIIYAKLLANLNVDGFSNNGDFSVYRIASEMKMRGLPPLLRVTCKPSCEEDAIVCRQIRVVTGDNHFDVVHRICSNSRLRHRSYRPRLEVEYRWMGGVHC